MQEPKPKIIAGSVPGGIDRPEGVIVAIGNFDGAHRGHAEVAREAQTLQKTAGGAATVALTFEPHPRAYFRPEIPLFHLNSAVSRIARLKSIGFDRVEILAFDDALAGMSADVFVRDVLVSRLGATGIVVGEDFRFGKGRLGTSDTLLEFGKALGFAVRLVPPFREADGTIISSSAIREALRLGKLEQANRMLGYSFEVSGTVIHGEKRGRELGYPTANIRLSAGFDLAHGIYACRAGIEGVSLPAVASFGRRPTFDNGAPLLEIHVFDFSGDLYGKSLAVSFEGYLRPEMKFDSLEAPIWQMDADSRKARDILSAP